MPTLHIQLGFMKQFVASLNKSSLQHLQNLFPKAFRSKSWSWSIENYFTLVETLFKIYSKMGCMMSLKLHILDAHFHSIKDNMSAYFKEQEECFHQDMLHFEHGYQATYNKHMFIVGSTWWETIFGDLFVKVIWHTLANLIEIQHF